MSHRAGRKVAAVIAAGIAAAMVMLGACASPPEPSTPAAAPPTAAPPDGAPTPTESPTDPYAIPEQIDEAYVERVLEGLGESYARAARLTQSAGHVTAEARAILRSTHGDESFRDAVADFETAASSGPGVAFRSSLTPLRAKVVRLQDAQQGCLFALVVQDASGLFDGAREEELYIQLVPKPEQAGAADLNPTPWVIEGVAPTPKPGTTFSSPCAG